MPQAIVSYRPTKTFEIAAGRDQLPKGLNLPDLGMCMRAEKRSPFDANGAITQGGAFGGAGNYSYVSGHDSESGGSGPLLRRKQQRHWKRTHAVGRQAVGPRL